MKTTHSEKAIETLTAMNTTGADWKHADIQWFQKRVLAPSSSYRLKRDENGDCIRINGRYEREYPMVMQLVMWGVIQWPAGGPRFESRFVNYERNCCELCSKTIKRSNRVPLVTADGKAMWVGADCAAKFTGARALKMKDLDEEARTVRRDGKKWGKISTMILADNYEGKVE